MVNGSRARAVVGIGGPDAGLLRMLAQLLLMLRRDRRQRRRRIAQGELVAASRLLQAAIISHMLPLGLVRWRLLSSQLLLRRRPLLVARRLRVELLRLAQHPLLLLLLRLVKLHHLRLIAPLEALLLRRLRLGLIGNLGLLAVACLLRNALLAQEWRRRPTSGAAVLPVQLLLQ